jgi:CheY-like chemotaxis protein
MTAKAATVLIASRDLDHYFELRTHLESGGVQVVTAVKTSEALDRLREESPHVVVLDEDLDPSGTGALLFTFRAFSPSPEIVLLTTGRTTDAVRDLSGLLFCGGKPVDSGTLFEKIRDSLKARRLAFTAPGREAPLVLCVDDDSLQLNALSRLLTRHGYRVLCSESVVRALSSLMEVQPDVAVVDVMMPGAGGLDLVERLNRRSGGRVPIVILSALNTPAARKAARQLGVERYLPKPCSDQELLEAIEASLAKAERK